MEQELLRQIAATVSELKERYRLGKEMQTDGGAGSGNWGHVGRPGIRGGSGAGGGKSNRIMKNGGFTSFSKEKARLAKKHEVSWEECNDLPPGAKLSGEYCGEYKTFIKAARGFRDEEGNEYPSYDIANEEFEVTLPESARWRYQNPTKREPVNGKNILKSYKGDKEDIEGILHEQGFDNLPKVVSKEEFEKAVAESHILSQRGYAGESKEVLDAYRESLYDGQFYVKCSGGAMYGKGMYSAANYKATAKDIDSDSETAQIYADGGYVEKFTMTPDSKIADYSKIIAECYSRGYDDPGAYAAAKGYDAIRTTEDYLVVLNRTKCIILDQRTQKDSTFDGKNFYKGLAKSKEMYYNYNVSKDSARRDEAVSDMRFRVSEDGKSLEAVRDGKVIGHIRTMETMTEEEARQEYEKKHKKQKK